MKDSDIITKALNKVIKESVRGSQILLDERIVQNAIDLARLDERKEIAKTIKTIKPKKCPKCNSKKVVGCKGGTLLKSNSKINYICEDCLWEW